MSAEHRENRDEQVDNRQPRIIWEDDEMIIESLGRKPPLPPPIKQELEKIRQEEKPHFYELNKYAVRQIPVVGPVLSPILGPLLGRIGLESYMRSIKDPKEHHIPDEVRIIRKK